MHLFLNIPKKYFLGIDRISGLPETSAGYFGIRLDICQDPLFGRKFYCTSSKQLIQVETNPSARLDIRKIAKSIPEYIIRRKIEQL